MFIAAHPEHSRGRFTLGEAAVLAGVEERAARHAINNVLGRGAGKLGARDVLFFALREVVRVACSGAAFQKALYRKLHEAGFRLSRTPALEVEVDAPDRQTRIRILIDPRPTVADVMKRVRAFRAGMRRVERRDDIAGGALVFRGTRVPVATVGALLKRGVPLADLRGDYPSLGEVDFEFARLAVELSPPRGRPRKRLQMRRHQIDRGSG